jgi:restriction system protein
MGACQGLRSFLADQDPLLSFKVLFQCKRYQGSVGASMIRDFRGALIGKADKGILLTTGSFTMDAKREATPAFR